MLPAGFDWRPGWLDPAASRALLATALGETPWADVSLRLAGRLVPMPRRVAFFGPHDYRYTGLLHPARALPAWLDDVRRRIEETARHPFNTVLMNLYRSGADSVSWHSDDDYPHGGHPAVASLSLGATRRFRIAHRREREQRYAVELTDGGLLLMTERSQLDYRHALPKTTASVGARINLTFRFMSGPN